MREQPHPPASLERPRLQRRLDQALATGHVLLTAPAGYGKSTLLRHLARQRPRTRYVPLTPADLDLTVLRARLQPLLADDATLLLDDVHLVEESAEVLSWLSTHLQQLGPRLVLSGRRLPALDLAVPLAAGQLVEFSEIDLAFTPAECHTLLAPRHIHKSPTALEAWRERLRGWPLGVGLLAQLAGQQAPLPTAETQLFRYLTTAVFDTLPPALHRFLRVTAIPLQFNDALAAHLLGSGEDVSALRREALRRKLFVEETERHGWFCYYDLIRKALLEELDFDPTALFNAAVDWFRTNDDLENAIDHALAGGLQQTAAALMLSLPHAFLNIERRMLTYRRWVGSLDESIVNAHPRLLINLGNFLHYVPGMQSEARALLKRAIALTENQASSDDYLWAYIYQQHINVREGHYAGVPEALRRALAHPACTTQQRRFGLELLAMVFADQSRYREARQASAELMALRGQIAEENLVQHRQNMAIAVLAPLGDFQDAMAATRAAIDYYADAPAWRAHSLLNLCELYALLGNWSALRDTLEQVEDLAEQIEVFGDHNYFWLWLYRTQLAIASDQLEAAEVAAVELRNCATYDWAKAVTSTAQSWLLRRRRMYTEAVGLAERRLPALAEMPHGEAQFALEHDIALGFAWLRGDAAEFLLHPRMKNLIQWRCRADLVRLRALLAVTCYRANDPRWRRHVHAALYALQTYWGYEQLLTRRDPDLGAEFWPLVLVLGVEEARADAALAEIGQSQPLHPLLQHPDPLVRTRVAHALVAVGHEATMPVLVRHLQSEQNADAKAALARALTALERQPPPPLTVQLLGGFRLLRGDEPVADDAWPRPIVLRLFHYFALRRGVALARDRILDDLWPDTAPDKAWTTFRSVYSRLRSVLEPFVRSKGPNRYLALEGDSYRFDPLDVVTLDFEHFEATVRATLQAATQADVPPLSEAFLNALTGYQPLLPALPYAEWLLDTRQRLDDLHIDGCLYAAETLLVHGRAQEAERWARRVIDGAPWLEEAYAALMRALSRQGQRSAALRVYGEAVAALHAEFEVPPSPQTEWLATRLRQGQEI